MKAETIKENGFKETEIGLIPSDWDVVNLGNKEYFEVLNSGIDKFENSKGYLSTSSIQRNKIIDVECDITYNDRPSRANMQPRLNTVWFAKMKNTVKVYDFTKENQIEVEKYILSTGFTGFLCNRSKTYPKYIGKIFISSWFNQIKDNLAHGSTQKAVNNQDIKKILIPLPSLLEQQKISLILSKIQQAIEQQDKIIRITKELKKSLMNKLFTEGLHGEEQIKTEIGLMPKSWVVVSLSDIFTLTSGKTRPKKLMPQAIGDFIYPVYGGNGVMGFSEESLIDFQTVVLGRVGEYCGCVHLTSNKSWVSDNALYAKEILKECNLSYLTMILEKLDLNRMRNTGGQPLISQSIVYSHKIPFPNIKEQEEIANVILTIDKKLSQAEVRKQTLQTLFKTMLNQLMTGKVRVKDLDIEVN